MKYTIQSVVSARNETFHGILIIGHRRDQKKSEPLNLLTTEDTRPANHGPELKSGNLR